MGTDKHTPIYKIEDHKYYDKFFYIVDQDGQQLCRIDNDDVDPDEVQANAELIVKAVNNYEAMKKLLDPTNEFFRTELDSLVEQEQEDTLNEISLLLQQLNK